MRVCIHRYSAQEMLLRAGPVATPAEGWAGVGPCQRPPGAAVAPTLSLWGREARVWTKPHPLDVVAQRGRSIGWASI